MSVLHEEAGDVCEGARSPASHLLRLLQGAVQVEKGKAMTELEIAVGVAMIFLAGLAGWYWGDR